MDTSRLLQLDEGYRRHPYHCTAGKVTCGYGRNLDDIGLDEEEAAWLLERDIARAVKQLRLEPYWLDLSERRQAVLINMVVNLGWPRFSGFKKFRAALQAKDYVRAAHEMTDSRWFTQVGQRAVRLRSMMLDDVWPRNYG